MFVIMHFKRNFQFQFVYGSVGKARNRCRNMVCTTASDNNKRKQRRRSSNRHFQLNPILILEFEIGVRIFVLRDIIKDNM